MSRPEVFINAAMSADGKISNTRREQVRISSDEDFGRVDELRGRADAILVGVGTVLVDNPSLTVKSEERRKRGNPVRVIADSKARTPSDAEVFDGEGEVVIGVGKDAPRERVEELKERARVVETRTEQTDLKELLEAVGERGVESVMVEGGAEINYSLIERGLVDRISVYVGPMIIGGEQAPSLVEGKGFVENYPELELVSVEKVGEGIVLEWEFKNS